MKKIILFAFAFFCLFKTIAGELIYPREKIKVIDKMSSDPIAALQRTFDLLGLKLSSHDFVLNDMKSSLLGVHYYYQQKLNGFLVDDSYIVLSVDSEGMLMRTYVEINKIKANLLKSATVPLISQQMALSKAWDSLLVNGELISTPTIKLTYSSSLNLIYKVQIDTTSPFGYWEVIVDALNGEIVDVKDTRISRRDRGDKVFRLKNKKTTKLEEAIRIFELKNLTTKRNHENILFASGSAKIFDPNPVVRLGRSDLQDGSDQSFFTNSYVFTELKDITFENDQYSLKGPKVTLIDFEKPFIAPSTSPNGQWEFERKDIRFNDVMTYHHIDSNVRHIESLGFVESKIIFKTSIEVDANGANGDDNSHYIPSSKKLAFGHGCVDDNEDADVILHELGHLIQHHINFNWTSGDTGAMGEGFGDYWAASYSYTTEFGKDFNPDWVFKWDGHNNCWPGRKLDAFEATYDPSRIYGAHMSINGGISDELWSTPIFQAFKELYNAGVPKADIDKIILESHFGFASGVKMPEMATSIVKTAKLLFPDLGYDEIYLKHFKKQKIL